MQPARRGGLIMSNPRLNIATLALIIAQCLLLSRVTCSRQDPSSQLPPTAVPATPSLARDLNRTSAHVQPTRLPQPPTRAQDLPAQTSAKPSERPATQRAAPKNQTSTSHAGRASTRKPQQATTREQQKQKQKQKQKQQQVIAASSQQHATLLAPPNKTLNTLAGVRARWSQMEHALADAQSSASQDLSATLIRINQTLVEQHKMISDACNQSLEELVSGLENQELWAGQMFDASAGHGQKLPSGLLAGTLTELGNFDECLAVADQRRAIRGQYCSVLVKPPLTARPRLHTICRPLASLSASLQPGAQPTGNTTIKLLAEHSHLFLYSGLKLGVCVPSSCSQADVQQLLEAYLIKLELSGEVEHCQREATAAAAAEEQLVATTGSTVGAKSPLLDYPIVSSISQNFDLTQQCILLAFLCLVLLILLGTCLDTTESNHKARAPPADHARRLTALSSGAPSDAGGCVLGDSGRPWTGACKRTQEYRVCSGPSSNSTSCRSQQVSDDDPHERDVCARPQAERVGREREPRRSFREFLVCFSLKRNLRSIAKCAPPTSHAQTDATSMSDLKVIHGLRTLSMFWIIFGHTIGLVSPEMMNNLFTLASLSCSSRFLQALLNATLAVDTFFMISGLVTLISFARKCKSALHLIEPSGGGNPAASPDSESFARKLGAGSRPRQACCSAASSPQLADLILGAGGSFMVPVHHTGGSATIMNDDIEAEITSVDSSASSVMSSGSSGDSSVRCIGGTALASKSSSQKSFIVNKALRTTGKLRQQQPGWPRDFQPLLWLLMRYLRLTPAYATTIGLSILLPSLGSGPFWPDTAGSLGVTCRANWWTNLLYVNNFIDTDKLCLIHSWYLSNDWQFFLLALALFGLFYKSRKLALLLLVSVFVASSATTFIVTLENDYPPTIVATSPAVAERWEFIHQLYYKPWPHAPPYLIGLVVGFLILKLQLARKCAAAAALQTATSGCRSSSALELARGTRLVCWLMFGLISFAVLNSIYPWNMGYRVDPVLAGLHSATFRSLWALCSAWLVFALVSRPRHPLALLLSWHGFQVTSRLTYCAYLVHPLVIYYHFGTLRERLDSSVYGQLSRFMATLLLSYLLALVLSLLVESPSIQLQRLLVTLFAGEAEAPAAAAAAAAPHRGHKGKRLGGKATTAGANLGAVSKKNHTAQTRGRVRGSARRDASHYYRSLDDFVAGGATCTGGSKRVDAAPSGATRSMPKSAEPAPRTSINLDPTIETGAETLEGKCPHLAAAAANQAPLNKAACGARDDEPPRAESCGVYGDLSGASRCCSSSSGSSSSAIDEEFQRKLAQAIGRGFKIRSKIVNGTLKQQHRQLRAAMSKMSAPYPTRQHDECATDEWSQLRATSGPQACDQTEHKAAADRQSASISAVVGQLVATSHGSESPVTTISRRGNQLRTFVPGDRLSPGSDV